MASKMLVYCSSVSVHGTVDCLCLQGATETEVPWNTLLKKICKFPGTLVHNSFTVIMLPEIQIMAKVTIL